MTEPTLELRRVEIEPAKPYYIPEPFTYDVANMLIHQESFPAYCHIPGDRILDTWNDRAYQEWRDAVEKYLNPTSQILNQLRGPEFVAFCCAVVGVETATGARIVRHDNRSSGFATFRIDVFVKGPDTPETPLYTGQYGANVICERPTRDNQGSLYGGKRHLKLGGWLEDWPWD